MDWNKFPFRVYSIEMPFHKKSYVFWNSQKNNYGTIHSVKSTTSLKLMIGKGLVSTKDRDNWFKSMKKHLGLCYFTHVLNSNHSLTYTKKFEQRLWLCKSNSITIQLFTFDTYFLIIIVSSKIAMETMRYFKSSSKVLFSKKFEQWTWYKIHLNE